MKDAFFEFEKEGWQRAAPHYDASLAGLTHLFVPALLRAVQIDPGLRLLDVCAGPGLVSGEATAQGARTVGVDFSPTMVEAARRRYPGLEFREGNAQELPFESASFDRVAMNFGAPHLSEPDKAFAEATRVLVPGGRYAYTTWAKPEENKLFGIVDRALQAHAILEVGIPEGPPLYSTPESGSLEALREAGFDPRTYRFETVTVEWTVPSADFFFEAERVGGVRIATLMQRQPPDRLEAIRRAFDQGLEPFRSKDGFKLPATGYVISAATPS